MSPAFIALALQGVSVIAVVLWKVFYGGTAAGDAQREMRNLREDLDELRQGMVVNNQIQNERHDEFYSEFNDLRLKVASYTGDWNGGRHRRAN